MARIISFSIEEDDLLELGEVEKRYRNRSEAIRAGVKHLALEEKALDSLKGYCTAIVIVVHSDEAEADVSSVKHDFANEVKTQVHNSLGKKCAEVFVLEGSSGRLTEFYRRLRQAKKIAYSKFLEI